VDQKGVAENRCAPAIAPTPAPKAVLPSQVVDQQHAAPRRGPLKRLQPLLSSRSTLISTTAGFGIVTFAENAIQPAQSRPGGSFRASVARAENFSSPFRTAVAAC